jgi:putative PIN family toxin of toxin-antitoxin system
MRVVLDANIIISAMPASVHAPSQILDLWLRGQIDAITSQSIIASTERALQKPYWQNRRDLGLIEQRLNALIALMPRVDPTPGIHGVAEDDEDDLVLATAVAAGAEFLVTGDRYLLGIGEFRGVRIVTARDFLDVLVSLDGDNADED